MRVTFYFRTAPILLLVNGREDYLYRSMHSLTVKPTLIVQDLIS